MHLDWHFSGLELRVNQEVHFKQNKSFAGFLLVSMKKTEQRFSEGSTSGTLLWPLLLLVQLFSVFIFSCHCVLFLNQHYKAEVCVCVGLCHSPFLL